MAYEFGIDELSGSTDDFTHFCTLLSLRVQRDKSVSWKRRLIPFQKNWPTFIATLDKAILGVHSTQM
jgi:hypothetical protein